MLESQKMHPDHYRDGTTPQLFPDLLEDAENPISAPKDLQQAVRFADEMQELEKRKLDLSLQMKAIDERYKQLQLELLPDIMLAIGVKKFSLSSGFIIEVKDFVRGSIPTLTQINQADDLDRATLASRREQALTWLRAHNAESIIKNQVVAEFGKGQDADAKKLFAQISDAGFKVKCEEEVNFQTLNSYLKTELAAGHPVPQEPFDLFVGKKAELKSKK